MDQFRRNPVLWLIVLGAILVYSVLEGGLLGEKKDEQGMGGPSTLVAGVDIGGPFELVDQTGKTVTNADFAGKMMLVYFGFTYCPDICPAELLIMGQAVDLLGDKAADVVPIFITVDPKRDPPDKMKDYVAAFHPRLVGLTGTAEAIRAVAKAYRVFYKRSDVAGGDADYLMDHSTAIYFMDREGQFLTHFPHQTPPEKMAQTIKRYL